jgi:hypothetical protein
LELAKLGYLHFYFFAEDSNLLFLAEINAISDMEKTPFNKIRKILLIFPFTSFKVQVQS